MAKSNLEILKKRFDQLVKEQTKILREIQKEATKLLPPKRKVKKFGRRVAKIIKG